MAARSAPAALRRQRKQRGRRPADGRSGRPPGQHRSAVQRQRPAPEQQRDRRGQQLIRRTRRTNGRETSRQGPGVGQRLRLGRGVRRAAVEMVRRDRSSAGARTGVLRLGRVRQLGEVPAGVCGEQPVLFAGDNLGERTPGANAKRFYGEPRMVLLRLEKRRRTSILRAEQRPGRMERQKGPVATSSPFDRKAGRAGPTRDRVLDAPGRKRVGPVRRRRVHSGGRPADRPPRLLDGGRRALLRHNRGAVAAPGRQNTNSGAAP